MKKIFTAILLLLLPVLVHSQFKEEFEKMNKTESPIYNDFEPLLYSATKYILSNSPDPKSENFYFATKVVGFWMDKDTGYSMPTFGKLFESLKTDSKQRFLNVVSLMHYLLTQKIEHNRLIIYNRIEGKKFSELEDVKEVQFEGAKILLKYFDDNKSQLNINSKTKKFIKAYKKGTLKDIMFK